jgi:[protein-PII] uridylyltransferase
MTISRDDIQNWRGELKLRREALEASFFVQKNPLRLLNAHSKAIDDLLLSIWRQTEINDACNLIAVGGYGRGNLFPHSDIDLLFLVPENVPSIEIEKIESLIGVLWDIGLTVGHSVRNLNDCIDEAAQDATVQTNLMEARLLNGNPALFKQFMQAMSDLMRPADFLKAKLREQDNRHAKFNDTAYSLEPNVKESPGGLRDLHMVLWLANSQGFGKTWRELFKNGLITKLELAQIRRHRRNLIMLRVRMHYLAARREDRLLFDFQNELADNLGFKSTAKIRASEQLMHSYYQSARYISLINEILLKFLANNVLPVEAGVPVDEYYVACHGLLEITHEEIFSQHPTEILKCFLRLQQMPQLEGFGPKLLRALQTAKKLINHAFRHQSENIATFMAILSLSEGVNHSMRRMNRYGVLGQYIPAFGRIVGQMQHDLFHVYTVDEHTLNVLANLRRFAKPDLKHEFPLCTQLFSKFDKPQLLYVAAIFHDIAKGRGGDHSTLGAKDALAFCKLHHLHQEESALVAWLVEAHLKLSRTAQKCDLSDPAIIEQFARFVENERRLIALYLLTVADIRGTSPVVWNAWKARLLENLFIQTRRVLNDTSFNVKQAILQRQDEATSKLARYGLSKGAYELLWQNVGEFYFTRFDSDEIAWQSRLLTPHVFTESPVVRTRLSPNGDGIQVMIYTRDQDDLFARICNFFDHIGYSIGQAKIYTTTHGYAMNTFIVLDGSGKSVSYSGLLKHIETGLTAQLTTTAPPEPPLKGRISRQVKHMPFNTEIKSGQDTQGINTQLDITTGDRTGLLAEIAFIFLKHHIDLHNAKINTLGNRVEDSFLISGKHNLPLSQQALTALKDELQQL